MGSKSSKLLDLAIIGGGAAALSAALYAARAGLNVEAFERGTIGGALAEIAKLSNYPGYTGPGPDLAKNMREQATSAGAKISYGECTDLRKDQDLFTITIDGEEIQARAVLVATGSEPRELGFTPEKPVSYCALCDGDLVKGKKVAVVGGANSAVQEGIYLADLARSVTIISHSPLKADNCLREKLSAVKNVEVLENTEATPELLDTFDHVFVYIGKKPATSFLQNISRKRKILDDSGYILTNVDSFSALDVDSGKKIIDLSISSTKSPHETAISGLFAAGDVRAGAVRQVITAAGDGATAAIEITNSLKSR